MQFGMVCASMLISRHRLTVTMGSTPTSRAGSVTGSTGPWRRLSMFTLVLGCRGRNTVGRRRSPSVAGRCAPQRLDRAAALFLLDPPALGRAAGSGGDTGLARYVGAADECAQTLERLAPVLTLAAVFPRLDDQYPVAADALIAEAEQPLLEPGRQGRVGDVQ